MDLTLKAYFALKGVRQKEVAAELGISRPALSRYLNGVRQFPPRYRIKLCRLLGISLEEFRKGRIVEEDVDCTVVDQFVCPRDGNWHVNGRMFEGLKQGDCLTFRDGELVMINGVKVEKGFCNGRT